MKPLPKSKYWVEAPVASVTDDRARAVLVLRLALAVNALRSQQRYTLIIGDEPVAAAAKRDRVLSFVIAAAFTREALNILTGTAKVPGESGSVKSLAVLGGVAAEDAAAVSQLMAGTHKASAVLTRVRNQLTFHWDPKVVDASMRGFEADVPLIWLEGETKTVGDSIYRLAADVLANALIVDHADVPETEVDAAGNEALRQATLAITEAMIAVMNYFEAAIAGAPRDVCRAANRRRVEFVLAAPGQSSADKRHSQTHQSCTATPPPTVHRSHPEPCQGKQCDGSSCTLRNIARPTIQRS